MRKLTAKDHLREAAQAHSNLNVFAVVVSILENGCIYGHSAAAERIIRICQTEQQRYLRAYDREVALTLKDTPR